MGFAKVISAYLLYDLKLVILDNQIVVTKGITNNLKIRARFDLLETK